MERRQHLQFIVHFRELIKFVYSTRLCLFLLIIRINCYNIIYNARVSYLLLGIKFRIYINVCMYNLFVFFFYLNTQILPYVLVVFFIPFRCTFVFIHRNVDCFFLIIF